MKGPSAEDPSHFIPKKSLLASGRPDSGRRSYCHHDEYGRPGCPARRVCGKSERSNPFASRLSERGKGNPLPADALPIPDAEESLLRDNGGKNHLLKTEVMELWECRGNISFLLSWAGIAVFLVINSSLVINEMPLVRHAGLEEPAVFERGHPETVEKTGFRLEFIR